MEYGLELAKLRTLCTCQALRAVVPYYFSRLTRLCAFAPYVHLCFAFFFALPDLFFTRLIYAPCAPYLITRLITHAPLNVAKSLIKRNL